MSDVKTCPLCGAKLARSRKIDAQAKVRRNYMLAAWAASFIGCDITAYAEEVMAVDMAMAEKRPVFKKLVSDIAGRVGEGEIQAAMQNMLARAKDELLAHI
ncbi:MAG: ATPase inhibitor subunit zeta [Pseudomonadota bacterium]